MSRPRPLPDDTPRDDAAPPPGEAAAGGSLRRAWQRGNAAVMPATPDPTAPAGPMPRDA